MKKSILLKIIATVMATTFVFTGCATTKSHRSERHSDDEDQESGFEDLELDDLTLPEIEEVNGFLYVSKSDKDHLKLAKKLENIASNYEGDDSAYSQLYRLDKNFISIRVLSLNDNSTGRNDKWNMDCYTFITDGRELDLDDFSEDLIDNCYDQLEDAVDNYKYIECLDEDEEVVFDEDTQWLIDSNSVVFVEENLPFRVFFDDNEYINPQVFPDGTEMIATFADGSFEYEDTTIKTVPGGYFYDDAAHKTAIRIDNQDYNYLSDIEGYLDGGLIVNTVYINNDGDLYIFSDYMSFYNDGFSAIFKLEDGELTFIDSTNGENWPRTIECANTIEAFVDYVSQFDSSVSGR